MEQPDRYQVTGAVEVEHNGLCACPGYYGDKLNTTMGIYETVEAYDEDEAARIAIKRVAGRIGATDAGCFDWKRDPTVENVSLREREQGLLAAWNAGQPIKGA